MRAKEDRFPTKGGEITHILEVAGLGGARSFYRDVLEATVIREYGARPMSWDLEALGSCWLQKRD